MVYAEKAQKAISLFEQALAIKPDNWASMWALGKIYQRMGDDATALEWFTKAHRIEPTKPDIIREASLCAMNLGKGKEAVGFTSAAIELNPDAAGLVANLALALLLDNRPQEAKEKAEHAVNANSKDVVPRNVLQFINEVISGNRPRQKTSKGWRKRCNQTEA
jgi:Flp pilus assembly protein TadD